MKSPTKGRDFALAACLALLLGPASGCAKPEAKARATPSNQEPAASREADKTQELEEKAAGYQERFQEIQQSDMTADEKAQAASELVDEQQRTVREAEDGSASDPQQ